MLDCKKIKYEKLEKYYKKILYNIMKNYIINKKKNQSDVINSFVNILFLDKNLKFI